MTEIKICLWFDGQAEQAVALYTSLVEGARIISETDLPPAPGCEQPKLIEFELAGARFSALDAGPGHPHTDAMSIELHLPDQASVDRVWDGFVAAGAKPVQCGWITDPFGVSWQVVPAGFGEMMSSGDEAAKGRAYAAMMGMVKLDLPEVQAAFRGDARADA